LRRDDAPAAPGTILQTMHFAERLATMSPGRFAEVGVGEGRLATMLLQRGWSGVGFELDAESIRRATTRTTRWLESGTFSLRHANWLEEPLAPASADLVLSSMVLEHLDEHDERRYLERAAQTLRPGGRAILFVPASPDHWGIEDDIAGHYRRYTRERLRALAAEGGWTVDQLVGLTYPLSNVLLGVSNRLVARSESSKRALTMQERTELSGSRDVQMKTRFPSIAGLVLNPRMLRPLYALQRRYADHPSAMVLYCELRRA
jgi:SAM-dependent methyltransferase